MKIIIDSREHEGKIKAKEKSDKAESQTKELNQRKWKTRNQGKEIDVINQTKEVE